MPGWVVVSRAIPARERRSAQAGPWAHGRFPREPRTCQDGSWSHGQFPRASGAAAKPGSWAHAWRPDGERATPPVVGHMLSVFVTSELSTYFIASLGRFSAPAFL